jgi:hypothetical protein
MNQRYWGLVSQILWFALCSIIGNLMLNRVCSNYVWEAIPRLPWNHHSISIHWCTFGGQFLHFRFWHILSLKGLHLLKLVKMAIVHVLRSVEDECCFSTLSFLNNKSQDTLNPHLPFVVGMYSQKFFTWVKAH